SRSNVSASNARQVGSRCNGCPGEYPQPIPGSVWDESLSRYGRIEVIQRKLRLKDGETMSHYNARTTTWSGSATIHLNSEKHCVHSHFAKIETIYPFSVILGFFLKSQDF